VFVSRRGLQPHASMSEHSGVVYQYQIRRVALKDWILVGCIILSYKGFNTDSFMSDVFAKKVLEKYPAHNWG